MQEQHDIELIIVRSYAQRLIKIAKEMKEDACFITDKAFERMLYGMADSIMDGVGDTSVLNKDFYKTQEEKEEEEKNHRDEQEYQRQLTSMKYS